jgi:hypothetical protein
MNKILINSVKSAFRSDTYYTNARLILLSPFTLRALAPLNSGFFYPDGKSHPYIPINKLAQMALVDYFIVQQYLFLTDA